MILSTEQIEAAFVVILGVPPRAADVATLRLLYGEVTDADVAEYIWDHRLGEPNDVTPDQLVGRIRN